MGSCRQDLLFVLCALCALGTVDANWRCHECVESVTIHVELSKARYSGSDNEGPPHFVNFTYLCTPKPNSGVPKNKSLTGNGAQMSAAQVAANPALETVAGADNMVYVAYKSANHKVLMNGWMERGTTSTYTSFIPATTISMCGGCVTPSELGTAFAVAGNRDGIQIQAMTIIADLATKKEKTARTDREREREREKRESEGGSSFRRGRTRTKYGVSVLLMLDRHFDNGWLDTNDYPTKANRAMKLTKAGC